jgi:ketosteroid isomerase-like protein
MPDSPGCFIVETMTTTKNPTMDEATAERLSARFGSVFETFDPGDLFAPDAFFDLNMPVWRFQLVGADAFTAQLKKIAKGRVTLEVLRTVPTVSGFVHEHEERQEVDGEVYSARRLWLCEVRDGRIAEVVGYCSGEWDEALRARHTLEAPMLRQ